MGPELTQDQIAEQLTAKKKQFIRCPRCGQVFRNAFELILCGSCGYLRNDYSKAPHRGLTIIKKHESTT